MKRNQTNKIQTHIWNALPFAVFGILLLYVILYTPDQAQLSPQEEESYTYEIEQPSFPCRHIAHAGGEVNGIVYSNSLEALNKNYRFDFRCFEIDGNWSSDGHLVAVHDWHNIFTTLFPGADIKIPKREEFSKLKMVEKLTPLSFHDIIHWLIFHPDAYIITDIKSSNREGLNYLAKEINRLNQTKLFQRIIPEVFTPEDFDFIKELGFQKYIFSLYNNPNTVEELILQIEQTRDIYGVAMPLELYENEPELIQMLQNRNIPYFVHTINEVEVRQNILKYRYGGIYTDILFPGY
ncbi:MAG: glycerophosphodiester phosphodiesterase family protein [Leptospirales bacterium]